MNQFRMQDGTACVWHTALWIVLTTTVVSCAESASKVEHRTDAQSGTMATAGWILQFATDGGFDYTRMRQRLDRAGVAASDFRPRWSHEVRSQGAFKPDKSVWIDIYNVSAIQGVINGEVQNSVMDDDRFFTESRYDLSNERLSLDDIEKGRLYRDYPDARLHFALVCAAESCPPLYDRPFSEAEDLDRLLDSLTERSVNDSMFVKLDYDRGLMLLSRLFEWYEDDFKRDGGSVSAFVSKYHSDGEAILKRKWKLKYRNYDWSLNQRPKRSE